MGNLTTDIPNLNISLSIDKVNLLKNVTHVQITGNRLIAQVKDNLQEDKYDEIAKQLRILFSLSFDQVYSEDFLVSSFGHGLGHHGHNDRKKHLLSRTINQNNDFSHTSQLIFKDVLEASATLVKQTRFFNLAYIWTRAQELEDLKLLTEAYVQFWRILDEMHAKGTRPQAVAALRKFGLAETESNIFAAQVLAGIGRDQRKSAVGEIADIAKLDTLRHPHAHQAGGRQKYYMEEDTHIEAEISNWFISDITKLFILWQLDLDKYYLNPKANIYEIKKNEE